MTLHLGTCSHILGHTELGGGVLELSFDQCVKCGREEGRSGGTGREEICGHTHERPQKNS